MRKWVRRSLITVAALLVLPLLLSLTSLLLHALPKRRLASYYSSSIAVYDKDRRLLRLTLSDDDKYRLWTPLSEISPTLVEATLLHEDRHFYHHFAVNPVALGRGLYATYLARTRRVGGSTISMQVARLRYHISSRTLRGKLLQIVRAVELELRYSKDELLEAYLNLVPFGKNIEGVGAASLIYFGKPVRKLALFEALTLAVIPQSPLRRASHGGRDDSGEGLGGEALLRARGALYAKWVRNHPAAQRDEALMRLPLTLRELGRLPFRAPHAVDSILAMEARLPSRRGNEIVTTLDLSLQQLLERQIKGYVTRNRRIGIVNATAMLVDTRDLAVRALVGSADFWNAAIEGQVNGTLARRSPGSTLKPFIYALGIDQGVIHPLTMVKDAQLAFGAYSPENFDGRFVGPLSAKEALVRSRNVPALWVAAKLTNPSFYSFLKSAGIARLRSEEHYGLSLVLGGGEVTMEELATLYAALGNRGVLRPLRYRTSDLEVPGVRVLSDEASFMTLEMLKDNPRLETGQTAAESAGKTWLVEPYRAAWKTGTSYGFRDAWTAGVIGPYVLVVWIGNFSGEGNPAFIGLSAAAPLFFAMTDALYAHLGNLSEPPRPLPKNLSRVAVCAVSGQIPSKYCAHKKTTWFIPGRSPIDVCQIHRPVLIDDLTGKTVCQSAANRRRTHVEVIEYWPSDLLRLFQQAGLPRRAPPRADPSRANCDLAELSSRGAAPRITSPLRGVVYTMRPGRDEHDTIALQAITDADAEEVFWFVGGTLLGKVKSGAALMWRPGPGKYVVRAVDDHGRSDTREITVALAN